jgi:hypothetical protein
LLRASTAIGQGELATHPLDMAMVVMAAINHGGLADAVPGRGGVRTRPDQDYREAARKAPVARADEAGNG